MTELDCALERMQISIAHAMAVAAASPDADLHVAGQLFMLFKQAKEIVPCVTPT